MANNTAFNDEIVFASSDSNVSRIINQAEKEGKLRKIAPLDYIEDKLEKIIIREGEEGINKFRDKTRDIAVQLGFDDEFRVLNAIISALLNTHSAKVLSSESAKARATGTAVGRKMEH